MSERLDELEIELRRLPGVVAVAFDRSDGLVLEVQAAPDASDDLTHRVTAVAAAHAGVDLTVEIVRWGNGDGSTAESRVRFVDAAPDTADGKVVVRLARGPEEAVGRAPTDHGLMGAVEATVVALRVLLPDLAYLPGWARTVETTPERRFLVVASVTDPQARLHRRGVAEGATPIEGAARATLAALNRTVSRDFRSKCPAEGPRRGSRARP